MWNNGDVKGMRSHGMGVQEVQAARDVQGDLVALAVPDELRALVLVQSVPQVTPRHVLRTRIRRPVKTGYTGASRESHALRGSAHGDRHHLGSPACNLTGAVKSAES